jgi:hypothetical protein
LPDQQLSFFLGRHEHGSATAHRPGRAGRVGRCFPAHYDDYADNVRAHNVWSVDDDHFGAVNDAGAGYDTGTHSHAGADYDTAGAYSHTGADHDTGTNHDHGAWAHDHDARAHDHDAWAHDHDAWALDYDSWAHDYDTWAHVYDTWAHDYDARAHDYVAPSALYSRQLWGGS